MLKLVRIHTALCAVAFAGLGLASPAAAEPSADHVRALDRMMTAMAPESARAAATIRRVYRDHLDLLFLHEFEDLAGALANGGVAPLPTDPSRFNLMPRLDGPHPIGEKDLSNQESYVAARPSTIGVLLELASRVHTGPVEITSLVRHGGYQNALRATNANASTSVPMHTMGLAVDIALLNTPLRTAYEIRKVLREMRDAGDILFIGERRQLVFHVVPHPSRLGYFNEVYTRAIGTPSATQAAVVVADLRDTDSRRSGRASVVTEVVAIAPGDLSRLDEWELAMHPPEPVFLDQGLAADDMAPHDKMLAANASWTLGAGLLARGLLALVAALGTAAFKIFSAT